MLFFTAEINIELFITSKYHFIDKPAIGKELALEELKEKRMIITMGENKKMKSNTLYRVKKSNLKLFVAFLILFFTACIIYTCSMLL